MKLFLALVLAGLAASHATALQPDVERRVTTIENQSLDARVRVLESDMTEIKYWVRGIGVGIMISLIVAGRQIGKKET